MNKVLLALLASVTLLTGLVLAGSLDFGIKAYHKDPVTWAILDPWINTNIRGFNGLDVGVYSLSGLTPNSAYTLIYYGYGTHNDEWPYATCIKSFTTNGLGWASTSGAFNYTSFIGDGVGQKFWIVPTSDLDCANNQFVAWNPTKILFESKTV